MRQPAGKEKATKEQSVECVWLLVKVARFLSSHKQIPEGIVSFPEKLLFLVQRALHQNRAFHQTQSGWACRLSVCLLLLPLLLSSQQPPASCLHKPGFCVLVCSKIGFFSCPACGVLFLFQVLNKSHLFQRWDLFRLVFLAWAQGGNVRLDVWHYADHLLAWKPVIALYPSRSDVQWKLCFSSCKVDWPQICVFEEGVLCCLTPTRNPARLVSCFFVLFIQMTDEDYSHIL